MRAELTRQRIITAAAHVFADHGHAVGTTNRIAERARISIGSLYQYFPNKDAILAELMTSHLRIGISHARSLFQEQLPDSLEEVMRLLVGSVVECHRDHPELLRVPAEQGPHTAGALAMVREFERECVAYVEALLVGHPEVRVADTHIAARLVVDVVELVVHHLVAAPDPVDLPRFENELVAMLTRYLTAAAAPAESAPRPR